MVRRSIVALAALALASSGLANAADAPRPLRTLVYAVQFSSQTRNAEQTSGFTAGDASLPSGHGLVQRSSSASDDGTLTVDVIGATADGGLAVDASFAGKATVQPPVRVAIFSDGRLSFDPRKALAPQAVRILPLLARGFVAERDVSPGATWKTEVPAPAKGATTYRVSELRGEVATLAIDAQFKVAGPQGYDEVDHGIAKYATDRLCPVSYDLTARSRHQPSTDQYVTENAHLTATLVSDTFARKQ